MLPGRIPEPAKIGVEERNSLVLANRLFVVSRVHQKWGFLRGTDLYDDAISEGIMGLLRAADKFDPEMGNTFITYAVHWVDQRIRSFVFKNRFPVSIPPNRRELRRLMHNSYRRSHRTGTKLGELVDSASDLKHDIIISAVLARPSLTNTFVQQSQPFQTPADLAVAEESRRTMMAEIEGLEQRSCSIVLEYHGFTTRPKTLDGIGRERKLTRERVRQILKRAHEVLRPRLLSYFKEGEAEFYPDAVYASEYTWPESCLDDDASPYFEAPNLGWVEDCPCCGDPTWSARQNTIACELCGYDSLATRPCFLCGESILIGFPCYCDYIAPRSEGTIRSQVHRILLLAGGCSVERLAHELEQAGIVRSIRVIEAKLYRDEAVIRAMDGSYYLLENAPEHLIELDRIEKRLTKLEAEFERKSEFLLGQIKVVRRGSERVSALKQELLEWEAGYLAEKERLIDRLESVTKS